MVLMVAGGGGEAKGAPSRYVGLPVMRFLFQGASHLQQLLPVLWQIPCNQKMSSLQTYQDSDLEREVRKQENRRGGAAMQRWRWFYVVLIGVTVAVLSMLVNLGIAGLNYVKIRTTERLISGPGAPAASRHYTPLPRCRAQYV